MPMLPSSRPSPKKHLTAFTTVNRIAFALTAALSAAVFAAPALAEDKVAKPVETAVNTDEVVRKVEDYLNSVKTIRSGFQQVVKGQGISTGTFYLKRPGRFLWAYNYPNQERLISTGKNLYFFEENVQQPTELPRNTPMVKLLGSEQVSLKAAGFKVEKASRAEGRLSLTLSLYDKNADLSTKATMVFIEKPRMRLEKFISTNQLNQTVDVSFFGYEEGVEIPDSMFKYVPTVKKGNKNEAF
jgi:outer membrane lipoprotein-sorting protein